MGIKMSRGTKKHLKRLRAPQNWMLAKLGGIFAPQPSPGPHKSRECLPMILVLRDRLKYALNSHEVKSILMQRLVKVDGKARTDPTYPVGFQDVINIERTNEYFRMMIDPKGRFVLHKIPNNEATRKLCRVKRVTLGNSGVPIALAHDTRSIPYSDPNAKANDTVVYDIPLANAISTIKFKKGNLATVTHGHSAGRNGIVKALEMHSGSHTIVTIRDALGNNLSTRQKNVFVVGNGRVPVISLLASNGLRQSILYEQSV